MPTHLCSCINESGIIAYSLKHNNAMKQYLLLFYLACSVCMLHAQDKESSPYLFNDFQEATVYFKDGSQYHEKMNYNLLVDKFYFRFFSV